METNQELKLMLQIRTKAQKHAMDSVEEQTDATMDYADTRASKPEEQEREEKRAKLMAQRADSKTINLGGTVARSYEASFTAMLNGTKSPEPMQDVLILELDHLTNTLKVKDEAFAE